MGRKGAQLSAQRKLHPADDSSSRRERALLSWIEQSAPYGVITLDESLHIQSWNRWMEIHSARRAIDVIGKDLFRLFPEIRERKLLSHFQRALRGESSLLSTALHRYLLPLPSSFRDAGLDHMLQTARIAPLFLEARVCGVVVVIDDVTQRESQALALGRQHRRDQILSWALAHLLKQEQPRKTVRRLFFKIAEHLDFDTFFLYLRDLESGALNLDAVGGVPGNSKKDFAGCPFLALAPPESCEMVLLNSLQTRLEPQYAALLKAGISAAVAIPLLANGRNLGLLCFATGSRESIAADESDLLTTIAQYLATALDRENTSRQLQKAKQQLSSHAQLLEQKVQERTARLQETIAELETFSYTLAHDLRAPIRALNGYCKVLLEDFSAQLPVNASLIVKKLARTSRRMEALVQDLLAFSKVSQQEVDFSRIELASVIYDLLALRPPAVRKTLTLRKPLPAVLAHRALLQQVLANLIDNAIKYVAPQTSPSITVYCERVTHGSPSTRSRPLLFSSVEGAPRAKPATQVETLPTRVRLWVVDQGIGIPSKIHQKIFGIFERGVSSELYEGTGMGLAIVARAMQRMGGACGVESEPGKGSRFWIELPAA